MKMIKAHQTYGEIRLIWGFWTGKYTLFFNGNELKKTGKTTFTYIHPETGEPIAVMVSGNHVQGHTLTVGGERIIMSPPAKWYDIVFGIIPCAFFFLFVQGAIGGALAGCIGMLSTFIAIGAGSMRNKILSCLGMSAVSIAAGIILSLLIGYLRSNL